MKQMESYVNCPECGKQIRVILNPADDELMEFAKEMSIDLGLGIENSDRFVAEDIKCKCGKSITVSMTVTAM
jgi:DNA-directed RNA polymerase subunit RPC12/RpoP